MMKHSPPVNVMQTSRKSLWCVCSLRRKPWDASANLFSSQPMVVADGYMIFTSIFGYFSVEDECTTQCTTLCWSLCAQWSKSFTCPIFVKHWTTPYDYRFSRPLPSWHRLKDAPKGQTPLPLFVPCSRIDKQFLCTPTTESRFARFHGEGPWRKTRPCSQCKLCQPIHELLWAAARACWLNRTTGVGRHTSAIPEAPVADDVGSRHEIVNPGILHIGVLNSSIYS